MKNLFLILAFLAVSSFAVASTGTPSEEDKKKENTEECSQEEDTCQESEIKPECRVRCSDQDSSGATITTAAGGIFTSCETAGRRCKEKLARAIQD